MPDNYGFRSSDKESNRGIFSLFGSYGTIKIFLVLLIFALIIWKFFTMVFAGFLAWRCFNSDLRHIRTFKTIMAIIFSNIYLITMGVCSIIFGYDKASMELGSFNLQTVISFFQHCC